MVKGRRGTKLFASLFFIRINTMLDFCHAFTVAHDGLRRGDAHSACNGNDGNDEGQHLRLQQGMQPMRRFVIRNCEKTHDSPVAVARIANWNAPAIRWFAGDIGRVRYADQFTTSAKKMPARFIA
jgi:hypothetical protein